MFLCQHFHLGDPGEDMRVRTFYSYIIRMRFTSYNDFCISLQFCWCSIPISFTFNFIDTSCVLISIPVSHVPVLIFNNFVLSCHFISRFTYACAIICLLRICSVYSLYVCSGTSLLRTLQDLSFSPYYRGFHYSEVI